MKTTISRRFFCASIFSGAALFASSSYAAPAELDLSHANVRAAVAVQNALTPKALRVQGVIGTAVGVDNAGNPAVVIYVNRNIPGAAAGAIAAAGGVGVQVELIDEIRALAKGGGGGGGGGKGGGGGGTPVSHTAIQAPPISLGTSGGWRNDLANGFCCGGTLGSLIQVNGVKFILSNYHVLEADIVSGGNGTVALTGDPVIQPGLIDVGCDANSSQNVASLWRLGSLPNYNVDVGIAQITPGMVSEDGAILEIGTISSQTVAASLNKTVKKSGRTSGLTRSKISGLNATISVAYDNECAGGQAFTKVFTGQIVVAKGSTFLKGGDSGSLMVEDVAANPRAIGLLYAGSTQIAIANPINEVLSFVGEQIGGVGVVASMVGN